MKEKEVQPQFRNQLSVKTEGLLQATKDTILDMVDNAVIEVKDGNVDKLDAYIFAKKMETFGKELAGKLKPIAETVPIGKTGLTKYYAEITESMQGVKWDYSKCGDTVLNDLLKDQEELKKKIENRQKFLQTITKLNTPVITEKGETYTVNPPVKSGSLGFSVKLK